MIIDVGLASGAMKVLTLNPAILILIPADQPLPNEPTEFIDTDEKLKEFLGRSETKRTVDNYNEIVVTLTGML